MATEVHSIDELLAAMVERDASDLHVTAGSPPVVRVNGMLEPLPDTPKLTPEETRTLLYRILSTDQQKGLEVKRQLDFSYSVPGSRASASTSTSSARASAPPSGSSRRRIKTLEELRMPTRLYDFCEKPRGLVLMTGPTGSGKSTTLASLLDRINTTRSEHILTIEDPIEFLHWHKSCIVNQREIGSDTTTFAEALRAALRQDPDVILVGEMRDLETIATALTAAETGHLVFATLHTQSAPSTIDRIIDVFPPGQQAQVRVQLSMTLQGIVTQNLVPTADGRGRMAALEILIPDDAVRNLIRQAKIEQIYSVMQTSSGSGMQTMEQALADLTIRRLITAQVAFSRCSRPSSFAACSSAAASPSSRPPRPTQRARMAGGVSVVDLKKEIKLSDLFKRPAKRSRRHPRVSAAPEAVGPLEERDDRRPQDRRLAARRRTGSEQRDRRARPARAAGGPRRERLLRRGPRRDRAGGDAGRLLPRERSSPARSSARRRDEPHRRTSLRPRRDRGRAAARERDSLPRAGGRLDPDRRGGARLPHRQRDVDEAGGINRRIVLAVAYREAIDLYTDACREAGSS